MNTVPQLTADKIYAELKEEVLLINPDGFSKLVDVLKDAATYDLDLPQSVVTYGDTGERSIDNFRTFERIREAIKR